MQHQSFNCIVRRRKCLAMAALMCACKPTLMFTFTHHLQFYTHTVCVWNNVQIMQHAAHAFAHTAFSRKEDILSWSYVFFPFPFGYTSLQATGDRYRHSCLQGLPCVINGLRKKKILWWRKMITEPSFDSYFYKENTIKHSNFNGYWSTVHTHITLTSMF